MQLYFDEQILLAKILAEKWIQRINNSYISGFFLFVCLLFLCVCECLVVFLLLFFCFVFFVCFFLFCFLIVCLFIVVVVVVLFCFLLFFVCLFFCLMLLILLFLTEHLLFSPILQRNSHRNCQRFLDNEIDETLIAYSNTARLYRQWRKIVFYSATNSLGGNAWSYLAPFGRHFDFWWRQFSFPWR